MVHLLPEPKKIAAVSLMSSFPRSLALVKKIAAQFVLKIQVTPCPLKIAAASQIRVRVPRI
jgi:hypothetical protein